MTTPISTSNPLRDTITKAYRMDEADCLQALLPLAQFTPEKVAQIIEIANKLVINTREYKKTQSKIDALLHQYDLSSDFFRTLIEEQKTAVAALTGSSKIGQDRIIDKRWTSEEKSIARDYLSGLIKGIHQIPNEHYLNCRRSLRIVNYLNTCLLN